MMLAKLINQKPYEKIEYMLHRSGITFLPTFFIFILLMAVPFVLYYLIFLRLFPDLLQNIKIYPIAVLSASIYYLSIFLFIFGEFVDFYLDSWVVTNDRILDIEQLGLFANTVSELDLYRIQDVTVDVKGFFPTIFRYGNVIIKTASGNSHVVFRNVPRPNEVGRTLIGLAETDRKFHLTQ